MVGPNLTAEPALDPHHQLDAPWNPHASHDARLLADFRDQYAAIVRRLGDLATVKAAAPALRRPEKDAISRREVAVVDDHGAQELPSSAPADALATLSTGPAPAVAPTPAPANGRVRQRDVEPIPAAPASRPSHPGRTYDHADHYIIRALTPVQPVAVPDRRFPAPPSPEAAPESADPPREPTPPPLSPPAAPPVPLFTMPHFATARPTNASRRPSNRRRTSAQATAVESVAPLPTVAIESVAPLPPPQETETAGVATTSYPSAVTVPAAAATARSTAPPVPAPAVLAAPAAATRTKSMASATSSGAASAAAAAVRTAATTQSMAEYIAAKRRTFGALLRPRSVSVDGSGAALRAAPESVVPVGTAVSQEPVQEEREEGEDEEEEEVTPAKTSGSAGSPAAIRTDPPAKSRASVVTKPARPSPTATIAATSARASEPAPSAQPVPTPTPAVAPVPARAAAAARPQTPVPDPPSAAPAAPPPRRSKRLVIDSVEIAVRNPPPPPPPAPYLAPAPSAPSPVLAASRPSNETTTGPTVPAARRSAQSKSRAGPETASRTATVDPRPAVPREATVDAASAVLWRDVLQTRAEESAAAAAAPPAAARRSVRPEPTTATEPARRAAAAADSASARPSASVSRAALVDERGPDAASRAAAPPAVPPARPLPSASTVLAAPAPASLAPAPEPSAPAPRRSARSKTRDTVESHNEPPHSVAPPVPPRPVLPEPMIVDAPRPAASAPAPQPAVGPPASRPAVASPAPEQPLANGTAAKDDAMAVDAPAPQPTLAAMHLAGRKAAKRSIDLSSASVSAAAPVKRRAVAASAVDGTVRPKAAAAVPNGDATRPVPKEAEPVLPPPRSTRSATRMAAASDAPNDSVSSTAAVPGPKAVDAPTILASRASKQGTGKSKRSTDLVAITAASAPAPPTEIPPPSSAAPVPTRPPARSDPGAPRLNLSAVVGAAVATGPTKSMSLSEQLSAMAQELEDATQGVADRNAASEATVSATAAVSVAVAVSTTAVAAPAAPPTVTNAVPKSAQALNNALVGMSKSTAAAVAAPKPMSLADAVMQYSAKMDKAARNDAAAADSQQDPHLATRLRLRVARELDARQQPRKLPATASAAAPPPPTPSRLRVPSALKPGQVLPPRAPAAKATAAATAGLMAAVKSAARANELTVIDASRPAANGATAATKDSAAPLPAPAKPAAVPAPAPGVKPAVKPAAPEPRKPTPPPPAAPAPAPVSSSVAARLKAASKAPPEPTAARVVPAPVPAVAKLRAAAAATAGAGRPGTPKATTTTAKPATPKPTAAAAPKPAIPAASKPAASTARAPPLPPTRATPARAAKSAAATAPAPATRAPPPKTPATRPGAAAARPAAAKPPASAAKLAPPPPKTPAWKKPPVFPPPKPTTAAAPPPPKTPSFARAAPSKPQRTPVGRVQAAAASASSTTATGPSESLYSPNTLARDESLFVSDQTDGAKQIPGWAEWDALDPVATAQAGWNADAIFGALPQFKVKEILPWMARRFNWLREDASESKPVPLATGELEQYRVAVVKKWPPPPAKPLS
ncbi:hypothetical protein GGF32_002154 [Allomyces javanicus]|nr:hypothetical protein GGF32_002154 [Allomyces javanicus]